MSYFLVKGEVGRREYMGKDSRFDDIRLVIAENAEEALAKWEAYWDKQSSEYAYTYYPYGEVMETIE